VRGVDGAALDLLGRDVVDRPDELASLRQRARGGGALGQTEVREVDVVAGGDQRVGRLDVAVYEAGRVRRVERRGHLRHEARGPDRLHLPLALQQAAQVGALDVAHRQEEHAVLLTRLVHRDDVGVLDRRGELRLALESARGTPRRAQTRGR
jgi:hypothetical protein